MCLPPLHPGNGPRNPRSSGGREDEVPVVVFAGPRTLVVAVAVVVLGREKSFPLVWAAASSAVRHRALLPSTPRSPASWPAAAPARFVQVQLVPLEAVYPFPFAQSAPTHALMAIISRHASARAAAACAPHLPPTLASPAYHPAPPRLPLPARAAHVPHAVACCFRGMASEEEMAVVVLRAHGRGCAAAARGRCCSCASLSSSGAGKLFLDSRSVSSAVRHRAPLPSTPASCAAAAPLRLVQVEGSRSARPVRPVYTSFVPALMLIRLGPAVHRHGQRQRISEGRPRPRSNPPHAATPPRPRSACTPRRCFRRTDPGSRARARAAGRRTKCPLFCGLTDVCGRGRSYAAARARSSSSTRPAASSAARGEVVHR
ncbi:hypothetical protein K438DRAFT_100292 [Mycena galopus ATCC 62051]|nr:hypothetical protein K438DRAFT_100292 [Mycena galopus ATCC 62051]